MLLQQNDVEMNAFPVFFAAILCVLTFNGAELCNMSKDTHVP